MPKGNTEVLPDPGIAPFGPGMIRMPRLAEEYSGLGAVPRPTEATIKEYNQFVKEVIDPQHTLDCILGRTRLIILNTTPTQIQIADDSVLGHNLLNPKQMTIIGRKIGSTVLTMWFPDPNDKTKDKILSYLVRVLPDPEEKRRLEMIYKALEKEIQKGFPDSMIRLTLVGDKLVASGEAKDVFELTAILRLLAPTAPVANLTGAHQ